MRQLLMGILMVAAIEANAAESPRGIVLRNECDKVDASMGFKCIVRETGLEIRLSTDIDAMSETRRKTVMGEFYRIVMRYYDLGGRRYVITSDHWAPTRVRGCTITPTRTSRCGDYKCNADRSDCDPIYAPH